MKGTVEFLTKGCSCKKTRCTNFKCSCRRNGRKCGPECRCKDCTNSNDSDHEDNEMTEDTSEHEDNEMTEDTSEHEDYEHEDMSEESSHNSDEDIQIEVIHMDIEE